jgi:hypothetical protein
MATRTTQETPFDLYVNAYSICSIMVRYTLAIRGIGLDVSTQMVVEEREVNIFEGEQMEEAFLCDVNPKGQVRLIINISVIALQRSGVCYGGGNAITYLLATSGSSSVSPDCTCSADSR